MEQITIEQLRARVAATRGPQFLLPARFATASFDNYAPDPDFPSQAAAVEQIQTLVAAPQPSRWAWRRRDDPVPRGIYLDGPPGIGKTHLLAAAYQAAPEPKLFATFDEFSAAAGTLSVRKLTHLLASQRLVCVDEIDLRDPGNIMLFTTLVRAMLAGRTRLLATANDEPAATGKHWFTGDDFAREFRQIAGAFAIVRIDGVDRRARPGSVPPRRLMPGSIRRQITLDWETLVAFLAETHPMYDAAWLQEVDLIALDRLEPFTNQDPALRFVRLIDRVYDRSVALRVTVPPRSPALLLDPLVGDPRFRLHVARCTSRLTELLSGRVAQAEAAG